MVKITQGELSSYVYDTESAAQLNNKTGKRNIIKVEENYYGTNIIT